MPPAGIDVRDYWERRLEAHDGLGGVGWLGLGESFNRWMYAVRRRVFERAARRAAGGGLAGLRVLDVGSGSGFYLDCWRRLGVASVTASDLTQVVVDRLRERRRGVKVVRLDIGGDDPSAGGETYDALSAMDVLFHIVDEDAYRRALHNIAGLLAPGGILLFSENFLTAGAARASHQVSRSDAEIRALLADAGLEPVELRPMFWLMNTPVDSDSRALALWWRLLTRAVGIHDVLGRVAGALLYPVELVLVGRSGRGPSTKLMTCRRR